MPSCWRWTMSVSGCHAECGSRFAFCWSAPAHLPSRTLRWSKRPAMEKSSSQAAEYFPETVFCGTRPPAANCTTRNTQQARRQGYDEVLFLNERGEVTEGAISNIFIEKDGHWFTPPVSCGLLPGIYRRQLLETSPAAERTLQLQDLVSADAVYICNAVRGCRKVTVVAPPIPDGSDGIVGNDLLLSKIGAYTLDGRRQILCRPVFEPGHVRPDSPHRPQR